MTDPAAMAPPELVTFAREILADSIERDAPLTERACLACVILSDGLPGAPGDYTFGAVAALAACTALEAAAALEGLREREERA